MKPDVKFDVKVGPKPAEPLNPELIVPVPVPRKEGGSLKEMERVYVEAKKQGLPCPFCKVTIRHTSDCPYGIAVKTEENRVVMESLDK